ncbi:MAG: hypothetical protein JNK58_04775 [Phycisphaerae bacterium]|nr:hypothetical protein [Phycisphaerae bacterium]
MKQRGGSIMRYLSVSALVILASFHPSHAAVEGTFKMDPVELVAGRETPGDESISAERYQYRYLFANEQNREEFREHPEKYEIQLGGACGRMGILSGAGDLNRYAVYDGRIYIFASDQCRNTFLLDPAAVLDPEDAPVTTDEAASRRGRELIDRAVVAMGGAERLDAVRSYQHIIEKRMSIKGEQHHQRESLLLVYPAGVRQDYQWDESAWSHVESPLAGWTESSKGESRELQPVERRFITRTLHHRNPVSILKARNDPGFTVAYAGPRSLTLGKKKFRVEEVHISYDGCTVTLGFDPNTDLIRTEAFVGRQSKIGETILVFTDHRDVSGLKVPAKYDVIFDGQPKEGATVEYTRIIIDDPDAENRLKK